ncbi:hypothetical protein RI129_011524 [Pyrocoelia pectoralis]|uniref:Uncharacterized protein n=1 Tax=Pyrocoelia pectoralis TaxID=417401 RepID=A0AAN7ZD10_9COLE
MDVDESHTTNPSVRVVEVEKQNSESCGFHLTRSKWDPYPWVSKVDLGTAADVAGMEPGECVLEINGEDVVGKRISEIAERVRSGSNQISLLLWNSGVDARCSPQSICCGPLPQNLQRLSTCVSSVLSFMECPVCLDTISPPAHQCENGHLVCLKCRTKTERCPVCRIRLSRVRSLLAEQIYNVVTDVFGLTGETQKDQKTKMQSFLKLTGKRKNVPDIKVTQTHTNKFLARLTGKSTSVDNLSNTSKHSASSVTQYPFEEDFGNILKTKSLSTSEIFKLNGPCSSRANSFNNLNNTKRLGKRFLNADKGSESSPTSLQGSIESLPQKVVVDDVLYPCPYQDNCTALIKGSIIDHFRDLHSGPLIQYFQSKFQLSLCAIQKQTNHCCVINTGCQIFFLRILGNFELSVTRKESNSNSDGLFLWMWILTDSEVWKEFQFCVEILNSEEEKLLSATSLVHSLLKVSSSEIVNNRKGVFLNFRMLEQSSVAVLRIEIQET